MLHIVTLRASLGDSDGSLTELKRVVAGDYPGTPLNLARPELDAIRTHPRFVAPIRGWLGDSPITAQLTAEPGDAPFTATLTAQPGAGKP